jgi:predicted phosphodiesterase
MNSGAVSIMVISDLHATSRSPGDGAGSWITTTTTRDTHNHPIVGLTSLVEQQGIKVDLLLCAGDITDKADSAALTQTWADINALAATAGATLIATAGNHDLDSQHGTEIDPRGVLFDLHPKFPHDDEQSRADYWSRNYCIVDGPVEDDGVRWRVVSLNTSAFHGMTSEQGKELDFGRISHRTVQRLAADLEKRPHTTLQVLLLHHHVVQLPDVDMAESSQIREIEHLLSLMERTGPWLVVHGHKHRPYFMYASGGAGSAAVFSSASMSAYAWGQASSIATNQVHLLTLSDPVSVGAPELGIAGAFRSWSWRPGIGWADAEVTGGWPGQGGFGWRIDPAALARMLKGHLKDPSSSINNDQLLRLFPLLPYLSPTDTDNLIGQLNANGISATRSNSGQLVELRPKLVLVDLQGAK